MKQLEGNEMELLRKQIPKKNKHIHLLELRCNGVVRRILRNVENELRLQCVAEAYAD
jgi:hypothetical protein